MRKNGWKNEILRAIETDLKSRWNQFGVKLSRFDTVSIDLNVISTEITVFNVIWHWNKRILSSYDTILRY